MGALDHYAAASQEHSFEREQLVMQHLPQVRLIAKRIHGRLPAHFSLDDLISTGIIGLLQAIDRYDPAMRIQLNTFAEHRIRGAILDSLREADWASRDTRRRAREIEAAIQEAKQRLGREPEDEEIAAELKMSPEEYRELLTGVREIELEPLESVSQDGERPGLLRVISDDESRSPARVVERSELERILALAIERMPKMERTILNLYYYEEMTLSQISRIVGLHTSRIAELRVQGVLRLRSHLQRVWPLGSRQ
jgi:RNA polymerase sigma factor FliA